MSSFPYVGLDEVKNDKIRTLKALFAEFIGTGILVRLKKIQIIMDGVDYLSSTSYYVKKFQNWIHCLILKKISNLILTNVVECILSMFPIIQMIRNEMFCCYLTVWDVVISSK